MSQNVLYNPARLSGEQRAAADLIVTQANKAGLDPAFMLALAVTESSLQPAVTGDDGISIGLFQLQVSTARAWQKDITAPDLLDAETNARLAMLEMLSLIRRYPGFTYGDYAEAWTLGGRGRFVRNRRNPGKVVRMEKAAVELDLTLDLRQVA